MRSESPALLPIFRSQHQAELLAWLLLRPDQEFSVSDLAERLHAPLTTIHREIVRLDRAGVVTSRTVGRSRLVRANGDHPAAFALTRLIEVTFGPRVVIGEEFALDGVERAVIFGSWAARYAGEPGPPPRDVDVLVVGSVDRADLYEAADRAQLRLGIEVNPVVRTPSQWAEAADALTAQIWASPHLTVLDTHESEAAL